MVRKTLSTLGLIILWILVVLVVAYARAFWLWKPDVSRGDLKSFEKHLVQQLNLANENKELGSASLVLIHHCEVAARHGAGVSNATTLASVNTNKTLYQMASVSKAVTAWGVMKLVEEGKINLDEPVIHYLKRWRFPANNKYHEEITARHLLSHTAGLDEGLGLPGFLPGERVQSLEEALTITKGSSAAKPHPVRVTKEPGMEMSYGNANYAVLQLLIEEVSQRSFADYMKERILMPLGMIHSSFDLETVISEGREHDLAPNFDSRLNPQPRRRYTATAAVALYSTSEDIAQFVRAFCNENPVLKPETLKQMMTPQKGTDGTWGLGLTLFTENNAGGYIVGHDGGAYPSWGAMVRINPATKNGFVLMVSGARGAVNQLAHDWVYWETGKITPQARRQVFYDSMYPTLLIIISGAFVIIIYMIAKSYKKQT